ncbi:MAG: CoA-binding protein [Pelodictyon luteolum]|jgi:predicted CoA-binding protein|uniref:CoA-binding protein n=1 Tax=Pelodictyon luteolum TaxID=1100 RepID=A0A165LQW4_PELLU|nr:CoA-binding protein [Pelodictyon luteolum]KZK74317.1 MAG: CoA-binding protein [Pelodictyon luteolum]
MATPAPSIEDILGKFRVLAIVGLSPKPERPSNAVARYMIAAGYTIIPINPGQTTILGLPCYPSLKALPPEIAESVEIVNIFRKPADIPPVVDEAIAIGAKVIWMQLGITNESAAEKAAQAGISVVQNRCISVEHQRHFI